MKRILVPTDFSNNAYSALFYATRLFKHQECKFYILNTFEVKTPLLTGRIDTSKGSFLYQKLSAASQESLIQTFHSIVRDTEDLQHTFETVSVSKDLVETIIKTIKSKDIDLVVMGTKGATGASAAFWGSNTVKTIQKIKRCPVLIVPDEFDFEKPINIAFPTDLKRFYLEEELQPLLDIASLFQSTIKIIHILREEKLDDIQEHNYYALKKCFKKIQFSAHWIPKNDQKTALINDFIDQLNINLLVMINYRHSFIENITHEPVIKKIGFAPSVPFLVIPDAS
ncbi:universal stress protein [Aquimarina sp. 2201CG5-10]|uniref:universal stress protein n=1 Tax=Aquimarina callyspongiae TaxID=3098150 RepID=UPI002AB4681F|nr:universal stress protein [Aquimarina sp. 2201CG5-10]MDY8134910.1 universal stress protein [Aquimarina sp. 2201CG5-10]